MPRKSLYSSINNLSYKSLLIILFFLLISIVVLWKFVLSNHKVEASWWNDGWNYRKAVSISNTSGSNLTDFQISLSIGTSALIASGKMQSDCDDIRITDINGNLLPYWIEENNPGCNQITDTKIWVKANSIPTSGSTIFIYYGNSSAPTAQSGDNTFLEFDDFNNSSTINNWIPESNPTTTYSIAGGTMAAINTNSDYSSAVFGGNYTDIVINSRLKVNASQSHGGFIFRGQTAAADNSYQWVIRGAISDNRIQKRQSSAQSYLISTSALPTTLVANTWYPVEIKSVGTSVSTYFNNQLAVNGNMGDSTYPSGKVGILSYDGNEYFDYIFVRKYASVEPTATLQSEEAGGGPIAYWKFDEGNGTTAYNSSSNSHTGTLQNGTSWASENQCVSGKCLKFDGVNDYVSAGTGTNYFPMPTFSICTWVKSPGLASGMTVNGIMSLTYGLILRLDSSGHFSTHMDDGSNIVGVTASSNSLYDNKFHHLCLTYDGSNRKMYIDGVLKSTTATTWSGTTRWSTDGVNIGHDNNNSPVYKFNGFIDEPKIYRYARTASQIKQDYNSRGSASSKGSGVNMGTNKNNNSLSDGLVGYWKMDEGIGTSTLDSSGNNHIGTFGTGTSAPGWVSGKYGIGGSFSNSYIDAGTSPQYEFTNNVTFSAWVKPSSISGWRGIVAKGSDSQYEFRISGRSGYTGKFELATTIGGVSTFSGYESTSALQTDVWQHVVATFDGSKLKYYLNGTLVGEYSISGSMSTNSSLSLRIGNRTSGIPFNGLIDEVRIYNRALSPAEVSQLYEYAPGPVGYWDFNEASGATVKDKSGNNYNGTLINSPIWTQGKIGSALNFDGNSNYVNFNNASVAGATSGTVEAWINAKNWDANRMTIFSSEIGPAWADLRLVLFSASNNSLTFSVSNGTTSIQDTVNTGTILSTNTWYHIVGTYDGSVVKIYVNGILKSSYSTTVTPGSFTPTKTMVGWHYSDRYFNGTIDEVKIYNYARTQKQIIEDMNASHPAVSANSAIAYYKFDEGYGTVTSNWGNGGIGLSGAFGTGNSAPTWSNDGKFGKGLYFDGSNDYVQTASVPASDNFSLSIWFKPGSSITTGQRIYWGAGTDKAILAYSGTSGNLQWYVSTTGGNTGYQTSTNKFKLNDWNHAVLVYNGTTVKFYINGILDPTTGSVTGTSIASGFYLGTNYQHSSNWFNGYLDEFKFYSYSLTDDEIKLDYNQSSALQMGQTSQTIGGTTTSLEYCIPGDTSYCASPVAEWKMDEGSGTSANDTSGNNNTGTLGTGNSAPTWTQGKTGSALSFNGSSNYIGVPYSSSLAPSAITFEAWAYKPLWTDAESSRILSKTETGGYTLLYSSGSIYSYIYRNGAYSTPSASTSGLSPGWHYFTGSYDGRYNKIYIDGVLKNTDDAGANYPITYSYSNSLIIGAEAGSGTSPAGTHFTGKIDHVKIYDYARTPAQIAYDYNKGGPVGWWKFDECQGNIAYDWSGIGNTGTIIIGASGTQNSLGTCAVGTSAAWTNGATGKLNSSLNFDGTDDYITIPNLLTDYPVSVSMWIKPNTITDADIAFYLYLASGKYITGGFYTSYGFITNASNVHADASLFPIGQWKHVVVTMTSSTTGKIYVDGIDRTTSSAQRYVESGTISNIAARNNTNLFQGQIDDVKVYNYALTDTQVKTLYNNGAVSFN